MVICGYTYKVASDKGCIGKLDEHNEEDIITCFYINIVRYEIHENEEEIFDKGINVSFELTKENAEKTKEIVERTISVYNKLFKSKIDD